MLEAGAYDAVVNLAAAGVTAGSATASEMHAVNVDGAVNLARLASEVRTPPWYIHVASSTEPLDGATAESEYSRLKGEGTDAVMRFLNSSGMAYSVAVVHNTYGPRQPQGRFVGDVVRSVARGERVHILHPGRIRDFCYVDDVASRLATVVLGRRADHDRPIREIGTGHGATLLDVALLVCRTLGKPEGLVTVSASPDEGEAPRVADRGAPGFLECPTSLEQGISRLAAANLVSSD